MKLSMKAECVGSDNVMQFLHHHQLATSLPLCGQSLGQCSRTLFRGYGESNLPLVCRSPRVLPFLLNFPCMAKGGNKYTSVATLCK